MSLILNTMLFCPLKIVYPLLMVKFRKRREPKDIFDIGFLHNYNQKMYAKW